ncbi:MAG: Tol-Pal system protein TolB, partial [Parasphingorhabdus sp.]
MQSAAFSFRTLILGLVGCLGLSTVAQAQLTVDVDNSASDELVIAVPGLPTQQSVNTPAGNTSELGGKISDVIVSDLRSSGLFKPMGRNRVRGISYSEVTAPQFPYWSGTNASALIQGFVRANSDGKLTVGCYLYDVALETELTRQGFVVDPGDWRRAAHKCADAIYSRLSGESPFFDSRIAYIAETGPKGK